jgi:hypothetical protein
MVRSETDTPERSEENHADLRWPIRSLHLVTISCLAVAQPFLDLLARHPEAFVIRRVDRLEILLLPLILLLVPVLPAALIELCLVRTRRRFQLAIHSVLIGLLAAPLAVQVCKRIPHLPGVLVIVVGVVMAALLTLAYHHWRTARLFVTALGLSLIVIPYAFFRSPGIGKLISHPEASGIETADLGTEPRAPVIFMVFDELPTTLLIDGQGRINPNRYPNLAKLSEQAYWFPSTTTVSEVTQTALPAILTGNFPVAGVLPMLSEHPRNLFTLFGGDYQLWVQEPITDICPAELNRNQPQSAPAAQRFWLTASDLTVVYLHLLLPEELASGLPSIDYTWSDFAAATAQGSGRAKTHFQRAIDAIRRDRRDELNALRAAVGDHAEPQLYFMHCLLPHRPYDLLPPAYRYPSEKGVPGMKGHRWEEDELLVAQAYQRFILQMQYLDHAIGELVERLRNLGIFEQSLIVLTADHGASFRPGGMTRLISEANAEDILPVPLLIKAPHQTSGRIVDAPVRTIDILPTVLDLLEVAPPWPMDGVSAVSNPRPEGIPLQVVTKERGTFTFDSSEILQRMHRAADAKLQRFGDGSDPLDLFRFGPNPDLVGEPLDRLRQGGAYPAGVRLKRPEQLDRHRLDSSEVPVFVEAEFILQDKSELEHNLAVAVNGTVFATTRSRVKSAKVQLLSAMLPLHSLREGSNLVELFVVETQGGGMILRRLERDEPVSRLHRAGLLDRECTHTYVIAAAAHKPGGAGSVWLTDLVLHNPFSRPANVQLVLIREGPDTSPATTAPLTAPPASSTWLVDVVGDALNRPGESGAILVGSDLPLLVVARTYNQTENGSYSQLVPSVPVSDTIRGTQKVTLMPLTGTSPSRTNIGFVNLDAKHLRLTVNLQAANGRRLRQLQVTVPPFTAKQVDRVLRNKAADDGAYATVTSSSSYATYLTYASVVDSGSGDPTFVMPVAPIPDLVIVPSVVHVADDRGGVWKTQVSLLFNGRRRVQLKVVFMPGPDDSGDQVSQTYSISPRKLLSDDDVLHGLLGLSGRGGLILDIPKGGLMVGSRTYVDQGQGSLGQYLPGSGQEDALRAQQEARLVCLSGQAAGYRTSLYLCSACQESIEVLIDLHASDGSFLGRRSYSLPALSTFHDPDLFSSVSTEVGEAYAVVRSDTPGAAYFVHASVSDLGSGDPMFVSAQLTPASH